MERPIWWQGDLGEEHRQLLGRACLSVRYWGRPVDSYLHQMTPFAEAEGPPHDGAFCQNLQERKYAVVFFKCISYKLFINYFVFCSCVLYAIWRKRDFCKYAIKTHSQTSLLAVSLTQYQAMLLWTWREESKWNNSRSLVHTHRIRELWSALLYPAEGIFETFFLEPKTEIITSQLLSF